MSNPIQLKITKAGIEAIFSAEQRGIKLTLDKIQYSSDRFESFPLDERTSLNNVLQESSIAVGGVSEDKRTLRFFSVIDAFAELQIGSMAVFTDEGVLFAIASSPNSNLFKVYGGISFVASFGLTIAAATLSMIDILIDKEAALAIALISQHELAINPHPQYATDQDVDSVKSDLGGLGESYDLLKKAIEALEKQVGDLEDAELPAAAAPYGTGMKYRDVRTIRKNDGTKYYNRTGQTIHIIIQFFYRDDFTRGLVNVGGEGSTSVSIGDMHGQQSSGSLDVFTPISFPIEPDGWYSVTNGYIHRWVEWSK